MKIIHYPQLDTVLMVEKFIKAHSGEYKKKALWQALPKQMMYQTFCVIFGYLEESNKIARDRNGIIGWVWDPEGARYFLARTDLDPERYILPETLRESRANKDISSKQTKKHGHSSKIHLRATDKDILRAPTRR